MKLLGDRGYSCAVAEPIFRIARIYEEYGVRFGRYELLDPTLGAGGVRGQVGVLPPHLGRPQIIQDLGPRRTGTPTGAREGPQRRLPHPDDEGHARSDHAPLQALAPPV